MSPPPTHTADTFPSSAIHNPTSPLAYFLSCPVPFLLLFFSPFIPWPPDRIRLSPHLLLSFSSLLFGVFFCIPFASSSFFSRIDILYSKMYWLMMDFLHVSACQKICFSISYHSPSPPLCPLAHFPPHLLHCLSFMSCRSTAENLCGHSWAPASVCLSCYSLTVGFWKSYFSRSNPLSSKALFIHREHTESKLSFTGKICLTQAVQRQT